MAQETRQAQTLELSGMARVRRLASGFDEGSGGDEQQGIFQTQSRATTPQTSRIDRRPETCDPIVGFFVEPAIVSRVVSSCFSLERDRS